MGRGPGYQSGTPSGVRFGLGGAIRRSRRPSTLRLISGNPPGCFNRATRQTERQAFSFRFGSDLRAKTEGQKEEWFWDVTQGAAALGLATIISSLTGLRFGS